MSEILRLDAMENRSEQPSLSKSWDGEVVSLTAGEAPEGCA